MGCVRVACFGVSLDGFGAGLDQSEKNPLGVGGLALHEWAFATRTWCAMHGLDGGSTGVDDAFMQRGFQDVGAWVIGRNMFGPVRGEWQGNAWTGWWGDEPPYHTPVFVLTHHARPPLEMKGGTTFHFVTEGAERALELAQAAAAGKEVRIGGGVSTIRQYLQAGLVDEMHLAYSPVVLGNGESLLEGIDLRELGYELKDHVATERVLHVEFERKGAK